MREVNIQKGELVKFLAKDKVELTGFLIRPKKSSTCIIRLHGMTSNFYENTIPFSLAEKVGRKGIAVFTMNTRGHDITTLVRKRKGRDVAYLTMGTDFERFEDSVLDIEGATSALKRLGFKRFILAGSSTGCQKITYYQYKKKDKNIKALILFAPADDYNLHKKGLGRKFDGIVKLCKTLVKNKRGNERNENIPRSFSAKRFLSVADLKNIEARIFNYEGELREFSQIKVPICALFGSKDQAFVKPVTLYLKILKNKSNSKFFVSKVIKGAGHSFRGREEEVSSFISRWLMNVLD